jgi:hypothetical protein
VAVEVTDDDADLDEQQAARLRQAEARVAELQKAGAVTS